jgi:signal transduction histidine kinase
MKTSYFFLVKLLFAWAVAGFIFLLFWSNLFQRGQGTVFITWLIVVVFELLDAVSHIRRVKLIVGDDNLNTNVLANRQRRQIELPMRSDEGFQLLDAAIRELPRVEQMFSAADSLQVRAKVQREYSSNSTQITTALSNWVWGTTLDLVHATITPNGETCSLTLVCEPKGGAWLDWFLVDQAANLENIEAITRAISRRVSEGRRLEQQGVKQTTNDKALAIAKLGLLHAQIEPHFLYNTLGSAKYLVQRDAVKAEAILDNLIQYLRHSLPRTEDTASTLGDELVRATAYLDILKIRMGDRLTTHINVAESLYKHPFPAMMLQTLVENAIKHGLEPKSGGGNIWILANVTATHLSVTVADDGCGIGLNKNDTKIDTTGTNIGINNVRERLQLAFGDKAAFDLVANFPTGAAATIRIPVGINSSETS